MLQTAARVPRGWEVREDFMRIFEAESNQGHNLPSKQSRFTATNGPEQGRAQLALADVPFFGVCAEPAGQIHRGHRPLALERRDRPRAKIRGGYWAKASAVICNPVRICRLLQELQVLLEVATGHAHERGDKPRPVVNAGREDAVSHFMKDGPLFAGELRELDPLRLVVGGGPVAPS